MEHADAIIIGAGPAGASCAIWLRQCGFEPVLIERRPAAGGLPTDSPYVNNWIAGIPGITGVAYGAAIARHLRELRVRLHCGVARLGMAREGEKFVARMGGMPALAAPHVVLATGARPRAGGLEESAAVLIGPGRRVHDADFSGLDVAVLGGGDNGFENCAALLRRGVGDVTLFARTVRARRNLVDTVPQDRVRVGSYAVDPERLAVNGRRFDRLLVFYGFEPNSEIASELGAELDRHGHPDTAAGTAETTVPGLFAIGDVAGRSHPCCATALADGVVAAKSIQRRLEGSASP